jgi:hypothetical protein
MSLNKEPRLVLGAVFPRVDALRRAAAVDEAALGGVEDGEASEDAAQAVREDFHEQLAQAALQADGPHVAGCPLLLVVLDQRHNDAGLPYAGEGAQRQAAREQDGHKQA